MRDSNGRLINGSSLGRKYPVGTVRVRTRQEKPGERRGERRAYIKVAEPGTWVLRAHHVWESANGPIPTGMGIHHRDRNTLNDALENLELVSMADHLAEHLPEFQSKCIAALNTARRERRWSTKSSTKRTGRPPTYSDKALNAAIQDVLNGSKKADAARRHGVPKWALIQTNAAKAAGIA